jgi:hypothetical protein
MVFVRTGIANLWTLLGRAWDVFKVTNSGSEENVSFYKETKSVRSSYTISAKYVQTDTSLIKTGNVYLYLPCAKHTTKTAACALAATWVIDFQNNLKVSVLLGVQFLTRARKKTRRQATA